MNFMEADVIQLMTEIFINLFSYLKYDKTNIATEI